MKVTVDEMLCTGCGPCEEICPEVFEVKGDVAKVKMDKIPSSLHEAVQDAADSCPTGAIQVKEEE